MFKQILINLTELTTLFIGTTAMGFSLSQYISDPMRVSNILYLSFSLAMLIMYIGNYSLRKKSQRYRRKEYGLPKTSCDIPMPPIKPAKK